LSALGATKTFNAEWIKKVNLSIAGHVEEEKHSQHMEKQIVVYTKSGKA